LRIICKVLSHKVTKNLADNTTFLAINRLIINQLDTFSVNPKYIQAMYEMKCYYYAYHLRYCYILLHQQMLQHVLLRLYYLRVALNIAHLLLYIPPIHLNQLNL
jgi:hypothetical protein